MQADWYEKLGSWEQALSAYEIQEAAAMAGGIENTTILGQMRCLHNLGRWMPLHDLFLLHWEGFQSSLSRSELQAASTMGCWAALATGQWTDIAGFVEVPHFPASPTPLPQAPGRPTCVLSPAPVRSHCFATRPFERV